MGNRDFNQRVLEQQIFDELKDTSIKSSEYFRRKYEGVDINYSRLYRRIINYQVKEYGRSLNRNNYVRKTRQDLLKEYRQARARRYYRRNR